MKLYEVVFLLGNSGTAYRYYKAKDKAKAREKAEQICRGGK
jgi:hypothetical protein